MDWKVMRTIVTLNRKDRKFWNRVNRNEILTPNIGRKLQESQQFPIEIFDGLKTEDKARLAASHGRHPYDTKRY